MHTYYRSCMSKYSNKNIVPLSCISSFRFFILYIFPKFSKILSLATHLYKLKLANLQILISSVCFLKASGIERPPDWVSSIWASELIIQSPRGFFCPHRLLIVSLPYLLKNGILTTPYVTVFNELAEISSFLLNHQRNCWYSNNRSSNGVGVL